ncbi:hypothetical protein [Sediminibacterium sp.]|uniref:hypothetical protein n=1 Tax=Sediminibacterium sp. TaxID=1917865 RepID=UPI002718BD19|nr:hypothetical protein [Sediminibacterium sp.]MDO9000273.1 hypothetical protein [Bacteroidota bacterium]MDP3147158.1 hypothetical protein [Bacteroidota bacterium]MDP3567313.1 hypothetical protein [Sediminibacterium sp.]
MKKLKLLLPLLIICFSFVKAQNNIRITSYYASNDKKSYYLAWDIKTGKSIQYYWNGKTNTWVSFEINIPEQPLPGATGNIMFDVYYDYKDGKAYYIAWDTKGGKSIQYYWNGKTSKWAAFEINLPTTPLPGATGEVLIKSYYSTEDSKAYYLVYDTNGGKSIQYYWDGKSSKWMPFEINLPAKPL